MQRVLGLTILMGLLVLAGACDLRKERQPPANAQPLDAPTSKKYDKNVEVVIDTSMGKIKAELFASKAPITVENFLRYVDEKHYDGTIFHRVISHFMIQGGGMERRRGDLFEKKTHEPIKNEAYNGLRNVRGTLAMARTNNPDSATSQFYINVKDNPDLDPAPNRVGYAVFGKVIEGMDVVDKIKMVATTQPGDVPVRDVVIKSIRKAE